MPKGKNAQRLLREELKTKKEEDGKTGKGGGKAGGANNSAGT